MPPRKPRSGGVFSFSPLPAKRGQGTTGVPKARGRPSPRSASQAPPPEHRLIRPGTRDRSASTALPDDREMPEALLVILRCSCFDAWFRRQLISLTPDAAMPLDAIVEPRHAGDDTGNLAKSVVSFAGRCGVGTGRLSVSRPPPMVSYHSRVRERP
jgi:hypothetical protein